MHHIYEILLFANNGERLGRVRTKDGLRTFHLGVVGEPLMPFLGERGEYAITLPPYPPMVTIVETDAEPNEYGYYPLRPAAFAALGAPDVTLAEWPTQ